MIAVKFRRLAHAEELPPPSRQSEHASGLDLVAAVPHDAPRTLAPGERALIPTGFAIELPPGFEGQVRPRSGLALKAVLAAEWDIERAISRHLGDVGDRPGAGARPRAVDLPPDTSPLSAAKKAGWN